MATIRTTDQVEVFGDISLLVDYSFTTEPVYADGDIWPMQYTELKVIHSVKFSTDGDQGIDLMPFLSKYTLEQIGNQLSYESKEVPA